MGMLYTKMQISFVERANRAIYTVQRLPFLKNRISDEWFVRTDIKKWLGIIALFLSAIKHIFVSLISYFLLVILPAIIYKETMNVPFVLQVLFGFVGANCCMGTFVYSRIFEIKKEDYYMLNLMHMNARSYFLCKLANAHLLEFVDYAIFMLVTLCCLKKFSLLLYIVTMLLYLCCRPIGEAVSVKRFTKNELGKHTKSTKGKVLYGIIMFILSYGILPGCVLLQQKTNITIDFLGCFENYGMFLLEILLGLAVLGGAYSVYYLTHYMNFTVLARRICNMTILQDQEKNLKTIKAASSALDDKQYTKEELQEHAYQEKEGYEYLNAIFFLRHKKLVKNFIRTKIAIAGGLFAISAIGLIIASIILSQKEYMDISNDLWKNISPIIGLMVLLMYFASSGRNLTNAMFYNCDVSLLKYGYYRTSSAILQNFRIRLRYMLRMEIPMALVLMAGIVIDVFLLRQQSHVVMLLAMLVCVCLLSVFYSIVYLCLYYIFQPYTEGGSQTGIGYSVCSLAIYFVAYRCSQVQLPFWVLIGLIFAVTVIVLGASFVIAYRVAPKTFHLK